MEKLTLFWLFTGIFAVTAIITLLGITGVIKTIKEKYLNALFTALILEVVAAVFLIFSGFDFSDNQVDLAAVIQDAGLTPPSDQKDYGNFIIAGLAKSTQVDSFKNLNKSLVEQLDLSNKEIEKLKNTQQLDGQSFYGGINFLHQIINQYKKSGNGRSINLTHAPENKKEVFQKLAAILSHLDFVKEGDGIVENGEVDVFKVRKLFERFKERYTSEEENLRFVEEYDLTQLIRRKLRMEE